MSDADIFSGHDETQETVFLNSVGTTVSPGSRLPKLSEDMLERLRFYGEEEDVDSDVCLYSHGDRNIDLFIVLEGGIDIILPDAQGGSRVYNQIRAFNFSGEINLFNSQGAVVEARTIARSRLSAYSAKQVEGVDACRRRYRQPSCSGFRLASATDR